MYLLACNPVESFHERYFVIERLFIRLVWPRTESRPCYVIVVLVARQWTLTRHRLRVIHCSSTHKGHKAVATFHGTSQKAVIPRRLSPADGVVGATQLLVAECKYWVKAVALIDKLSEIPNDIRGSPKKPLPNNQKSY